jgi:chromosome segregation ATPase
MPRWFGEIAQYAALLRDVGIVLGFPVLIVIAQRMHAKHIATLQAQIDLAKATQYDRALSLIDSQKKLFLAEREMLENRVAQLQKSGEQHRDEIAHLQAKVRELNVGVDQLTKITYNIEESFVDTPEGISVYQGLLIGKCDGVLFKTRLSESEITQIAKQPDLLESADRMLHAIRQMRRKA